MYLALRRPSRDWVLKVSLLLANGSARVSRPMCLGATEEGG